jgi:hypothetical protein
VILIRFINTNGKVYRCSRNAELRVRHAEFSFLFGGGGQRNFSRFSVIGSRKAAS